VYLGQLRYFLNDVTAIGKTLVRAAKEDKYTHTHTHTHTHIHIHAYTHMDGEI
jgi:hypothetical protein